MPVVSYRTIQSPAEGLYKEKGSKFLAFAYPVLSEEEIKQEIEVLKKKYFDARHHCFAWILGPERKTVRAYDDGEPNHSAGDPILGQIRSRGLTNVLVVVVRYFGGVKLGVGGLISAYKAAADDALAKAVVIEKNVLQMVRLVYGYTATPAVMRLVKELDLVIVSQKFEATGEMICNVKLQDKEKLAEKLQTCQAIGIDIAFSFPS